MQNLLYVLPALACPIGMGVMMWLMMRGMGGEKRQMDGSPWPDARIGRVGSRREAQIAELRAQLGSLEARNRALLGELETRSAAEPPTEISEVSERDLVR